MSKVAKRTALCLAVLAVLILSISYSHGRRIMDYANLDTAMQQYAGALPGPILHADLESAHKGADRVPGAIMPKLLNETAKAELGRHAWYLFHTILSRYPESPDQSERDDLASYINLFAKLYPCGDCAAHFMTLLIKYPPQTSSRKSAAQWGCAVHNKVNARLGKSDYDCTRILEEYDCGCGDDGAKGDGKEVAVHMKETDVGHEADP